MTCPHAAASQEETTLSGQCPLCLLALGLEQTPIFTPGTILASRFRLVALLGRGGMGEVYRADDLKLGQPVALKFLSSRFGQAVYDEVRIGRQIAHPNVCRIYDVFEIDGLAFIEMEWIEGEDLASLLARAGTLPYETALEIGRDLCAALEAAHQKGIVHGDLKPANIMIDEHGRARITDFGLSRLTTDPQNRGLRGGTLSYMAPEQKEGGEATPRSDLYALGIVLYELFTGSRERTSPPRLSLRDRALAQTILQCLADDPQKRPASARHVLDAFPEPSPETIADSDAVTALRPAQAWSLLAAFLAAVAVLVMITSRGVVPAAPPAAPSRLPQIAYILLLTATLLAGAWLARRNLRPGRVDRKGATRVALWVFACRAISGLLAGPHPLTIEAEASFLTLLLGASLLLATEVWLGYVALEPLVRRIAPHAMITWTRLQLGRVRDPVVGRDVLIGALAGIVFRLLDHWRNLPATVFGSMRMIIATLFHAQARAIFYALFALFLLILLRLALRHWLAASIVWLIATTLVWSQRADAPLVAAQMLALLILLRRFGLLAAVVAIFVQIATRA